MKVQEIPVKNPPGRLFSRNTTTVVSFAAAVRDNHSRSRSI